tara:strand:+ start:5116 stop:5382 length:267 start_codon:yes stop_codon:yes gene_type:complete
MKRLVNSNETECQILSTEGDTSETFLLVKVPFEDPEESGIDWPIRKKVLKAIEKAIEELEEDSSELLHLKHEHDSKHAEYNTENKGEQ